MIQKFIPNTKYRHLRKKTPIKGSHADDEKKTTAVESLKMHRESLGLY